MANRTKRIRMIQAITLKKNVMPGCPNPCKILLSVVLKKRNGQIQLKVRIKVPASAFAKIKFPINCPVRRNAVVQSMPSRTQDSTVFLMASCIFFLSWFAWASAISGRRRTETEFVTTVGNMIIANAIPVMIP